MDLTMMYVLFSKYVYIHMYVHYILLHTTYVVGSSIKYQSIKHRGAQRILHDWFMVHGGGSQRRQTTAHYYLQLLPTTHYY